MHPILWKGLPVESPGVPFSMMKAVMPSCFFDAVHIGKHDEDIRHRGIGDEGLRAVEDIPVALLHRRGPQGGGIRTGARLGEPHAADPLARCEPGDILFLLLLGAEIKDVMGAQVGMGAPGKQAAAVHPRMPQGLSGQAAGDDVRPRPAQFLGKGQPQYPHERRACSRSRS